MWYWNPETVTLAWNPEYEPRDSEIEDAKNNYNLQRLQPWMTREDVYSIMGMPDSYAHYETVDRDYVAVFYYYTQTKVDDGAAAKNEVTPVVIRNGKLVGWGAAYLKSIPEYTELRLK
jgi:hypothetical protein